MSVVIRCRSSTDPSRLRVGGGAGLLSNPHVCESSHHWITSLPDPCFLRLRRVLMIKMSFDTHLISQTSSSVRSLVRSVNKSSRFSSSSWAHILHVHSHLCSLHLQYRSVFLLQELGFIFLDASKSASLSIFHASEALPFGHGYGCIGIDLSAGLLQTGGETVCFSPKSGEVVAMFHSLFIERKDAIYLPGGGDWVTKELDLSSSLHLGRTICLSALFAKKKRLLGPPVQLSIDRCIQIRGHLMQKHILFLGVVITHRRRWRRFWKHPADCWIRGTMQPDLSS